MFCGAAVVFALWILVRILIWIICPWGLDADDFVQVGGNHDWEYSDDWVSIAKRKRFDARRWVRSKQWMAGSPIPHAYYSDDDIGEAIEMHYGSRDGLEKVDETNGSPSPLDELPHEEEDDEVPDYWHEWNEGNKVQET